MRGMTDRPGVVVLTVMTVLTGVMEMADAHQLQWGSCSSVKAMQDFEPERFNGTWYVLKKLVTSSRCMSTQFVLQDGGFLVTELRTPILVDLTTFKATVSNEGTLTFDPELPAKMELGWKGNKINNIVQTYFTIVDTDYDTFAVDVECQSWMLFKRVSATIMARDASLPDDVISKLEDKLATEFDINLKRMNTIDQSNCFKPDEVDYNVKVDDKGIRLLGLLEDKVVEALDTKEKAEEYFEMTLPPSQEQV